MEDVNKIVKRTKRFIDITLIGYVLTCLYGVYLKLVNDSLTNWTYISIGIGVFIIYSLLTAKKWAKIYVSIVCAIIIVFSGFPILEQFSTGNYPLALTNLAILMWSIFLIWFLNHGGTYDKYVEIVNKGYDYSKEEMADIESIIDKSHLIEFDRRSFNTIEDYLVFAQKLFDKNRLDFEIESIHHSADQIIINTAEIEYEVDVNLDAIFFDNDYLGKLISILQDRDSDYSIVMVYPNTVAYKGVKNIALLNSEEIQQLSENGMVENI